MNPNRLTTTLSSYGEYSNSNYGAHTMKVTLESGDCYYYSYRTLIAFTYDHKLYISENCWGATTGKHLNFIDRDKSKRFPRWEFEELFQLYHGKVEEVA